MVAMKGGVIAAIAIGTRVEVWVSSPTGDSSDSHVYDIPCLSEAQAKVIAQTWRNAWGIDQ